MNPSGAGWRGPILAHFTHEIASVARLTIVADPDQLLNEQGVLEGIRRQGFDLIPFDDHVAFRFEYESRYRQVWDRGEGTTLVVVLRSAASEIGALPYDLLLEARRQSRLLSFSIGELFPKLAPQVVSELDRSDLDALYHAQAVYQPDVLGENATRDFILRHVFGIAPELITTPADLLRVLLRRHYQGRSFPSTLDDRFVYLLRQDRSWSEWPLEVIVPDRSAFLTFLEERWPRFLRTRTGGTERASDDLPVTYTLKVPGPIDLPFDHDDVRVYIDNLFVEGHLAPTGAVPKDTVQDGWMRVGVAGDAEEDARVRLTRLIERVRQELPSEEAPHDQWVDTAFRWAELLALRWTAGSAADDVISDIEVLHDLVEERFAEWLTTHFASLHNLAYLPSPAMVHQIPRFLAHRFVPSGAAAAGEAPRKHALVVVDGLALDQWVPVREGLVRSMDASFEERGVFAWVPTLTSVSRQAIFSGDAPLLFAPSLRTTAKEPNHWRRFWEDAGALRAEISYACQRMQESDADYLGRIVELAEHPRRRILGIVVGTIDRTIHGTVMGSGGLHASVRHWVGTGFIGDLISMLTNNGFEVFITSDHGNVEATGIGKPNVGAIADDRGERAHVFRDDLTRAGVQQNFPTTIPWAQIGLPEDYRPLLASGRSAFITEGRRSIAHGGISLEEVIVPFVRVAGRP